MISRVPQPGSSSNHRKWHAAGQEPGPMGAGARPLGVHRCGEAALQQPLTSRFEKPYPRPPPRDSPMSAVVSRRRALPRAATPPWLMLLRKKSIWWLMAHVDMGPLPHGSRRYDGGHAGEWDALVPVHTAACTWKSLQPAVGMQSSRDARTPGCTFLPLVPCFPPFVVNQISPPSVRGTMGGPLRARSTTRGSREPLSVIHRQIAKQMPQLVV